MGVLLTTYGSRRDVEPLVGLATHLRALGAEPPDVRAAGQGVR
jgi:vancomycin aglycone glucosyltransferase